MVKRGDRGYVLIILMMVVFILAIALTVAVPVLETELRREKEEELIFRGRQYVEAVLKEDLFQFRKLIDQYFQDKGKYPAALQALVEEKYLRSIPVDPLTKSATTWVEVRETPAPDEYTLAENMGVVDVRSGSDAKALDGTLFNTW